MAEGLVENTEVSLGPCRCCCQWTLSVTVIDDCDRSYHGNDAGVTVDLPALYNVSVLDPCQDSNDQWAVPVNTTVSCGCAKSRSTVEGIPDSSFSPYGGASIRGIALAVDANSKVAEYYVTISRPAPLHVSFCPEDCECCALLASYDVVVRLSAWDHISGRSVERTVSATVARGQDGCYHASVPGLVLPGDVPVEANILPVGTTLPSDCYDIDTYYENVRGEDCGLYLSVSSRIKGCCSVAMEFRYEDAATGAAIALPCDAVATVTRFGVVVHSENLPAGERSHLTTMCIRGWDVDCLLSVSWAGACCHVIDSYSVDADGCEATCVVSVSGAGRAEIRASFPHQSQWCTCGPFSDITLSWSAGSPAVTGTITMSYDYGAGAYLGEVDLPPVEGEFTLHAGGVLYEDVTEDIPPDCGAFQVDASVMAPQGSLRPRYRFHCHAYGDDFFTTVTVSGLCGDEDSDDLSHMDPDCVLYACWDDEPQSPGELSRIESAITAYGWSVSAVEKNVQDREIWVYLD